MPATATFQDSGVTSGAAASFTYNGLTLSEAPGPYRKLLIVSSSYNNSGSTPAVPTGVTADGVAAALVYGATLTPSAASNTLRCEVSFWLIDFPSNTDVDVVITFSSSLFVGNAVAVWALNDSLAWPLNDSAIGGQSNVSTVTIDLADVLDDDWLFGAGISRQATVAYRFSAGDHEALVDEADYDIVRNVNGNWTDLTSRDNTVIAATGTGGDRTVFAAIALTPKPPLVTPSAGPITGGTSVTITGYGFTGASGVTFDGIPATSVVVVDDETITCDTPAHPGSPDIIDVVIDLATDITLFDAFEYSDTPIPEFISITPSEGPTAGGSSVTITGNNFTGTTSVEFGGDAATSVVVVNDETITCDTPAHAAGLVDIEIINPTSFDITATDAYEFITGVRVTQAALLVVDNSPIAARVSQVPILGLYVPFVPARVTQSAMLSSFLLDPVPPPALLAVYPVEERWTWKTTIHKTYAGGEQRMSLRDEPFQTMNYSLVLLDDIDRQTVLYTFHRYIGDRIRFPLFVYRVLLDADASIGDTVLSVDTTIGNFREGEDIAIYSESLDIYMVLETVAMSSSTITLAIPLDVDLEEGLSVAPAPSCRIADKLQFSMQRFTGNASVQFAIEAGRAILRPDQNEAIETLDGIPLLPDAYIAGTTEQINYDLQTFDNGLVTPQDTRTWHTPQIMSGRAYLSDADQLDYWRQFADEIKGSRNPFILPSYRSDFTLSSTPALGATVLQTEDTYLADYMKSRSPKYLRIVTANGAVYRKVTGATLNMDRTVTVYLSTALGSSAGDNDISMISLAYKVRLADDVLTLRHESGHVLVEFNYATVDQ